MTEHQIQALVQILSLPASQFRRHLEGITRWWVSGSSPDASPALVEAALKLLIKEGIVSTTRVGGRAMYRGARNV